MDVTTAPAPVGTPNFCVKCNRQSHREGFAIVGEISKLIFGLNREGYVWLCAQCSRDVGKAFGMVFREQYEEIVQLAQQQDGELAALRAELEVERAPEAKVLSLADALELARVVDLDTERESRRSEKAGA